MFVCDDACDNMLERSELHREEWRRLKAQAKSFRWPDKPVLFDRLERLFMDAGCDSTLMVLHKSPGLLAIKKKAGLL